VREPAIARRSASASAPVLLCDLDGVLVDSTAAIDRVYRRWAAEHGLDGSLVVATAQGRPSREVVRVCAPGLDAEAQSAAIEAAHVADQDGVMAVAGAHALLARTPAGRLAVVTSCSPALAAARMAAAGLPAPPVCVTADEVARGKPDPEGYLRAAGLLGANAADCVVVEDAPAGVEAGLAAGMHVVAVLTSHPRGALTGAHAFVADLTDVAAVAAKLVG
jgi:sugar-phosphatase